MKTALRSSFEALRFGAAALFLTAVVVAFPGPAAAVVTSSTRTVSYSPTSGTYPVSGTSVFAITFPFTAKDQIQVVENYEPTDTDTTLIQGAGYTVTLGVGTGNGSVTTDASYDSDYTITISRVTPLTQETRFTTQGRYSPYAHELAFDKLTFLVQETRAAVGTSGQAAVDTHVGVANPHTQYVLHAGKSGGQTVYGGTATGQGLTLYSNTSNDGKLTLGTGSALVIDENLGFIGIGTASPSVELDVAGQVDISTDVTVPLIFGSASPNGDLVIEGTSDATVATSFITLGNDNELVIDDGSNRVGIGTASPSAELDVKGGVLIDPWDTTDGIYVVQNTAQADTELEIRMSSDETDEAFRVMVTPSDTNMTDATGIGMFTATHSTATHGARQQFLELYGNYIAFMHDPNAAEHSYVTSAVATFGGALTYYSDVITMTSTKTMGVLECGSVTYTTSGVAATATLPRVSTLKSAGVGCRYIFVSKDSTAGVSLTISPNGNDTIYGSCIGNAAGLDFMTLSGALGKDLINTSGSNLRGDTVTLESDGSAGWWITTCTGVWDEEP